MSSVRVFAILTPTMQGALSQSEQICEESVERWQKHHHPDSNPNGTTKYNTISRLGYNVIMTVSMWIFDMVLGGPGWLKKLQNKK